VLCLENCTISIWVVSGKTDHFDVCLENWTILICVVSGKLDHFAVAKKFSTFRDTTI